MNHWILTAYYDKINELIDFEEPSPIRIGLLGLDLETKTFRLTFPQELHAFIPTLRINVVLPVIHQSQLLGNIRWSAIPSLISIMVPGEIRQMGTQTTRWVIDFEEPSPIRISLLGLDLESEKMIWAMIGWWSVYQEIQLLTLYCWINLIINLIHFLVSSLWQRLKDMDLRHWELDIGLHNRNTQFFLKD